MEEITVLVADDEEEIRNLVAIYLQNEGYCHLWNYMVNQEWNKCS